MTASKRAHCGVPGCCRTTAQLDFDGAPFKEWICSKHWPAVNSTLRRIYNRAKRSMRQAWRAGQILAPDDEPADGLVAWTSPSGTVRVYTPDDFNAMTAAAARASRIWRICKRDAIEKAMGI